MGDFLNQTNIILSIIASCIVLFGAYLAIRRWYERGKMRPKPLRSLEGATPSLITFFNASKIPLSIYWIDYNAQEEFRHRLESGQSVSQSTFATHPWRVKNDQGRVLREVIATSENQDIAL